MTATGTAISPTRYYTVLQTAALLHCAPNTVRRYIRCGTISAWEIRRRTYGHTPWTIKGTAVQRLING